MAGTGKKWLVGCGLGCGGAVVVAILIIVGSSFLMMKPFNKAVTAQKALTARYGERGDFVPRPDGITPDRVAAFLAVRDSLMPQCEDFRDIAAKFQAVDALDKQEGKPRKGEVLKTVGNVMSAAMGMAGQLGRFTRRRNEALMGAGMGLGEYVWIYTLAYNSWLGHTPNMSLDSEEKGEYSGEDRRIIRRLMLNHAEALTEAGRAEEAVLWREEAQRLEGSPQGVPFADGNLPAEISDAFAPYRDALESRYCAPMSPFEFGRVRKKGLSIRSD